ncbi:MAG: GNAT family N-acetyltransferase [Candidatus Eisenbacteria bacterium]
MHVARLSAADVERYRELMLLAYTVSPDAFTSTPEERAAEPESWWLARLADPTGLSDTYGAFDGDELVGSVTVQYSAKPKTRHKAHLVGMFVRESCRGRGAGAKLLRAALAAARSRPDVRTVTLTVTEGNRPAIGLYERHGFRTFGVEPMAIATPDGFKGKVHMWTPIGVAVESAE